MFPYFFVLSRIIHYSSIKTSVCVCVLLETEPRTSCPLFKGPIMEPSLQTGLSEEVTREGTKVLASPPVSSSFAFLSLDVDMYWGETWSDFQPALMEASCFTFAV